MDLEAAKLGLKGLPRSDLPSVRKTLAEGWVYIVPLVALVLLLLVLLYSPEKSALFSLLILILVTAFSKKTRLGGKGIISGLDGGARAMCFVAVACAVAGIIISNLSITGVGTRLSRELISLAGGNLVLMLGLAAVASFVLGMGTSSIPCYIMLAILVGPALVGMGVEPIAAHLFFFWFGIVSFITPPVCFAAYVAASIAGAEPMRTGFQATRLGIVTYFLPFMWVFSPALLLIGSVGDVALAVVTSIVGVTLIACGVSAYIMRPTIWWERIIVSAAGLLLVYPGWITDVIGVGLATVILLRQVRKVRSDRANATAEASD